jgi:hypothetical protein
MGSESNVDSFGTYLDNVVPGDPESDTLVTPAPGMTPVLKTLARSGAQRANDVLTVSGLDVQSYAALLQTLQGAKLITLAGEGAAQRAVCDSCLAS